MEKKKVKPYKLHTAKPSIVEEPLVRYGVLDLDASKRYNYADYLTWVDDKSRELINGFIHLMSAPNLLHARLTHLIGWFMESFVRQNNRKCRIFHAPFDVRLPLNNESDNEKIYNVVQPDICVICDLSKLDEKGCLGAPDLIVEVLSPSTLKYDLNDKFNLYETAGVKEYWIVDPKAKIINIFLLQPDGKYDLGIVYECNQKAPIHIFRGMEIKLNDLFEE